MHAHLIIDVAELKNVTDLYFYTAILGLVIMEHSEPKTIACDYLDYCNNSSEMRY